MDHPTSELTSWVDDECETSTLGDERLGYRLRKLLSQLSGAIGKPIPMACQDWANTKAAYRFLSNKKVNEQDILAGHFHATANRFLATTGPILVLQDTTEFSYTRNEPSLIGSIGYLPGRKIRSVGIMPRKLCGLRDCRWASRQSSFGVDQNLKAQML